MSEIASLELKITSDGVEQASGRLKKFTAESGTAERATDSLSKTIENIRRSTESYSGVGRRCASMLSEIAAEAQRTEGALDRVDAAVSKMRLGDINRLRPGGAPAMTLPGQSHELPELLRGGVGERATEALQMMTAAQAAATRAEADFVKGLREADAAAVGHSGALGHLREAFGELIVPVVASVAGFEGVRKVIEETTQFENLIARLQGVAGGAEEARAAFDKLEEISDGTIFTENQMVEAFLRLQQTGLDPSERALQAFANIASGTGKSLDQLTEMTLSASMGVFRGLKDLGIKAVAEGDQVKMTYRGITSTIENSAEAIQEYLVKIGETQYAGAAARQLDTMGGAVKELETAWGDLFREIGRSAIGDVIKTTIGDAASALKGVTVAVEALLYTVSKKPAEMSGERKSALNDWIRSALGEGQEDEGKAAQDRLERIFKETDDVVNKSNHRLRKYLDDRQHILDMSVRPDFQFDARQALADLDAAYAQEAGAGKPESKGYDVHATTAWNDGIRAGQYERDVAQEQFDKVKELADLQQKQADMAKRYADAEIAAEEEHRNELEQLSTTYRTADEEIVASHERRLKRIQDDAQKEVITEREKYRLLRQEDDKFATDSLQRDLEYSKARTDTASAMFGSLSSVAKAFGGEQSGIYKGMFAAQKAFAVASATVSMFQDIAKAQAEGGPFAGPFLALKVAADVAAIIAQISSTNYSGAYDAGGRIPAGRVGLVGEYGPEFVRGPAEVTSRRDTRQMLERAAAGGAGGAPQVSLRIVNAPDVAAAHQWGTSVAGERVIMNVVTRNAETVRRLAR